MKNNSNENSNSQELKIKSAILILTIAAIPVSVIFGLLALSPKQTTINECKSDLYLNKALATGIVNINTDNGEVPIKVEIADTDIERSRGLMCRTELDDQTGMLFIFEEEQTLSFWMKNTLIPLDIIFLDSNLKIITIHKNAKPLNVQNTYISSGPAKFALELKGGQAEELSLSIGDTASYAILP